MLPQIDIAGQKKLLSSHVLLFGAGALGSPIAMYLCASGIGKLTLVDPDKVELSNLQRQIIYYSSDVGSEKVKAAKINLHKINHEIEVNTINKKLIGTELLEAVLTADIVIDGTDNFEARFAINAACVKAKTALVTGAAIRFEGQIAVFDMKPDSACYQCLYANNGELDETCADNGILGSIAGVVGSIQATEVVKYLLGIGNRLQNRLMLIDALNMEWNTIKVHKDPKCEVCD